MNGKTSKAKPKMADITRPKKTTAEESPSLVIQPRPIIGHETSVSSPVSDEDKPSTEPAPAPTAPTLPSESKRTVIVPISGDDQKASKPEKPAAEKPAEPKQESAEAAPEKAVNTSAIPGSTEKKQGVAPPASAEAAKDDTPEDEDADEDDAEDGDEKDEKKGKDDKPNPETQKALEAAAAAEKREKELEEFIDSHQFFVPINAVARKRSVKHSALLTFLVLLLALVLVDLMLDSGLIFLVQRIPHTHFFTTTSIDQK
jgi:hypothetical protein